VRRESTHAARKQRAEGGPARAGRGGGVAQDETCALRVACYTVKAKTGEAVVHVAMRPGELLTPGTGGVVRKRHVLLQQQTGLLPFASPPEDIVSRLQNLYGPICCCC